MASASNRKGIAAALLVIVLSSLLFWFGNGLNPKWPLLWFAPLPVLMFASRHVWWSAALVAALSSLIGSLNMWHYFSELGMPVSVWAGIFLGTALIFAAAVILFSALLRRRAFWTALLAFPAAWLSNEYLRNLLTPHGTAGSFAYSQLSFLPFLQLASITGPWGITFLLLLFPAALTIVLHLRRSHPRQALRLLIAPMAVITAVLLFGAVRLAAPESRKVVKVGLLASDTPANVKVADEGRSTERLLADYAAEAQELAHRGAEIIVLPEKLGVIVDPESTRVDAIFQSLADKTLSIIVVGLVHVSPPVKYNQARVYAPGASVRAYDKHHLLPPFESSLKPGTTLTLLQELSSVQGIAICKDLDFTPLSRRYGRAGAGLMLVPAWDFNMDRAWHGHIAIMRGVESGFSIVRAAKNGYLTVSDNRGRILAETRSDSGPFARLLADVPIAHDGTVYLMAGDWFAWCSVCMLIFAVVQVCRPLRRQSLASQAKEL